jgi:hypothetical protein
MQAGKEIQLLEDARPGAIGPKVYGADFKVLIPLWPVFMSYVLSKSSSM